MINCPKVHYIVKWCNIGITHVFSCINICRVLRMLFEHEADRPTVQHHPRDPTSVNALKQTCVIVILAYFTLFQHKPRWKRRFNIKYPFSKTWFLKTKWRQRQTFERHYVATTSYIRVQRFWKRKHRRNDLSQPQRFPVYRHACKSGPSLGFFK